MTDKIQDNDQKESLIGLPEEPYLNDKGEVEFIWKEKPLKPG